MSSMSDRQDNTSLDDNVDGRSRDVLSDPNTSTGIPIGPIENCNTKEDRMFEMASTMDALRKELADQHQRHTDLSNTLVAANAKLSNKNDSFRM